MMFPAAVESHYIVTGPHIVNAAPVWHDSDYRNAIRVTLPKCCKKRAKNTMADMYILLLTCSLVKIVPYSGKSVFPVM